MDVPWGELNFEKEVRHHGGHQAIVTMANVKQWMKRAVGA
jgi:hypothetical protein